MREKLDALGERWAWFGVILRLQKRYSELNGNYMATAVTLAGFLSLFPLLLVGIALLGKFSADSANLANDVIKRLGLTGAAAQTMADTIHKAEQSRKAASIVGVVGLLWSGLGLVAAVQYALNTTWQVTGRGMRDKLTGLAWLAGALVLFLGSIAITAGLNFLPGFLWPLGFLAGLLVNIVLWLWTMRVLTNRDVGWKGLLPGALLGAVGMEVLKAVGSFYVPGAVRSSSALYGSLGVVFALLAWLLLFGRLVVYSSVLNVVMWEDRHGTVTVDIEMPRVPGEVTLGATRAGDTPPKSAAPAGAPASR
jgi:membrane protein